jgi:hypothetical protein
LVDVAPGHLRQPPQVLIGAVQDRRRVGITLLQDAPREAVALLEQRSDQLL